MSTELSNSDYSLEDEYGWVLDGIEKYVEDNLDDFLEHFGIKGMHWGVRKSEGTRPPLTGLGPDKIERVTKSGDKITLTKKPPTAIHKGLARISSKYREAYNNGVYLAVTDKHGKKIGDANFYKRNGDELYINWIGIKKSARGHGYGTAIMEAAQDFGSKSGMKKMTLEVPGNSPDARHIYESMGFKVVKEGADPKDPVWGGLTSMEYTFDTVKHHAEVGEDFLAHYGKMGMRWGVRNRSDDNTRDANTRNNTLIDHTPRTGMSKKKKVAIGVGGALLVGGIAATAYMMSKNGKGNTPIISIRRSRDFPKPKIPYSWDKPRPARFIVPEVPKPKIPYSWDKPRPARASTNGSNIVNGFNKNIWDTQVKDFDRMIAESHSEQTIHMRKAMREAGGQYVVRDNPFTPEARNQ